LIVKQDKGYETRSDKPNENWTDEGAYIVEDGTDLANKIIANYPYFEFVLDNNSKLIDITPTERPPEPPPEPTELELLKEKYAILQGAVDFIVMNP